jgi:hypothetical protein
MERRKGGMKEEKGKRGGRKRRKEEKEERRKEEKEEREGRMNEEKEGREGRKKVIPSFLFSFIWPIPSLAYRPLLPPLELMMVVIVMGRPHPHPPSSVRWCSLPRSRCSRTLPTILKEGRKEGEKEGKKEGR